MTYVLAVKPSSRNNTQSLSAMSKNAAAVPDTWGRRLGDFGRCTLTHDSLHNTRTKTELTEPSQVSTNSNAAAPSEVKLSRAERHAKHQEANKTAVGRCVRSILIVSSPAGY